MREYQTCKFSGHYQTTRGQLYNNFESCLPKKTASRLMWKDVLSLCGKIEMKEKYGKGGNQLLDQSGI